jgi:hypothetical protein
MLFLEVASSLNVFYFIAPTTHTQSIDDKDFLSATNQQLYLIPHHSY